MPEIAHPTKPHRRAADARKPHARTRGLAAVYLCFCFGLLTTALLAGRRYIDPGSGSFAIQIIIAAVLGGLLTARLWLRHFFWRVAGLVRRKKPEEQPAGEEADR